MAATFQRITRSEFEGWLFDQHPGAVPSEEHTGVYLLPLSTDVALYISTSLSQDDRVMGKGRGACHMKLVSLKTKRTLNRKGLGQTRYNRTSGWRTNWAQGIVRLADAYDKHQEFYNRMARETQEEYAARKIAQIAQMDPSPFLNSLKQQLKDGKFLTAKQEAALTNSRLRRPKQRLDQDKVLPTLRELYKRVRESDDSWTQNFVGNIGKLIRDGEELSSRQCEVLNEKLSLYGFDLQV